MAPNPISLFAAKIISSFVLIFVLVKISASGILGVISDTFFISFNFSNSTALLSIDSKAVELLKLKLIKKVSLITPNIPEAEILTKTKIRTKEDMIFAANKLIGLGAKNVLIKGGHLKHKNVIDILINKKDIKIFKSERHKTKNTHGTGCTLSSSVTTFLSCGKTVKKSCELGIKYVYSAIKSNPKYGKGHGPINHLTSLKVNRKFK